MAASSALAFGCVLYGAFGAGVLGVTLDLLLVLGALLLLCQLLQPEPKPPAERHTHRFRR